MKIVTRTAKSVYNYFVNELRLYLLGSFEATLAGQPIQRFAYDKVRVLLAYLALETHTAHHREKLAAFLWPDASEQAARTSLRKALSTLRLALQDTDAEQPVIFVERDTVQLNLVTNFWLDVNEFQHRLAACTAHAHFGEDECARCVCEFEAAMPFIAAIF